MKKTVLIIEDDELLCSVLFDLLEAECFNVLSAGDGFSGLRLIQESQPDLIISDLNLPKLNGLCLLKKLREDLITSKIPFIFFTAETNPNSRLKAMELGANDYLIKPIDFNLLLDVVIKQLY